MHSQQIMTERDEFTRKKIQEKVNLMRHMN